MKAPCRFVVARHPYFRRCASLLRQKELYVDGSRIHNAAFICVSAGSMCQSLNLPSSTDGHFRLCRSVACFPPCKYPNKPLPRQYKSGTMKIDTRSWLRWVQGIIIGILHRNRFVVSATVTNCVTDTIVKVSIDSYLGHLRFCIVSNQFATA